MVSQQSRSVVVDASVFLKWQLGDEAWVAEASALRDDCFLRGFIRAIAPQLLAYEAANALVIATRQNRLTEAKAVEVLENLVAFGVELREVPTFRILKLSLEHKISAYDAAYLALAEDEDCDLWTGDKVFYQAVRRVSARVRWIGDYKI